MATNPARPLEALETTAQLMARLEPLLAEINTDALSTRVLGAKNGATLSGVEPDERAVKLLVLVERGVITHEQMADVLRATYGAA